MSALLTLLPFYGAASRILSVLNQVENNLKGKAIQIAILISISSVAVGAAVVILGARADSPGARALTGTKEVKVVAAVGVQGYSVDAFCEDELTKVLALPAPDATNNTVYQLTRLRDGKFETVVAVLGSDQSLVVGTHYYDALSASGRVEQQSEPAYLTTIGRECLLRKVK